MRARLTSPFDNCPHPPVLDRPSGRGMDLDFLRVTTCAIGGLTTWGKTLIKSLAFVFDEDDRTHRS